MVSVRQIAVSLGIVTVLVLVPGVAATVSHQRQSWQPHFPETPFPAITASRDPAIVSEGKYLFTAVAHCTNCHLPKKAILYTSPEVTSELVPIGGGEWDLGPIGVFRSPNLTSDVQTGIGGWSDAEIARALRYSIDREGRALPYMVGVGPMGDRDLQAIISYLRTLPAVKTPIYRSEVSDTGQEILKAQMPGLLSPKTQFSVTYVPRGDVSIARGAYLANGPAMCFNCHSRITLSPEFAVDRPRFAGAFAPEPDLDNPEMEINAPNLTPSVSYGVLNGWNEEAFIARIRAGRTLKHSSMPWENFRLMTDADLASIFRYLRSLGPVDQNVGPSYRPIGWKPAAVRE